MSEFLKEFRATFPKVDLLTVTGPSSDDGPRSPYRQELLYALRISQDNDTVIWNTPGAMASSSIHGRPGTLKTPDVKEASCNRRQNCDPQLLRRATSR